MTNVPRPLPKITAVNRPHWEAATRHELRYPRCLACGAWIYPIASMCQACWSDQIEWQLLSGHGDVSTWIVVHRALHPAFQEDIPYVVGEVNLDEGIRVIGKFRIERAVLRAGLPVQATFEDVTPEVSLLEFEVPGR